MIDKNLIKEINFSRFLTTFEPKKEEENNINPKSILVLDPSSP